MSARRVRRGGSYYRDTRGLRTADRSWYGPERRGWNGGFRLVVKRRKP